jgi:Cu(I)/Ag(I) efflux system membrane protein CusA/SilA
VDRDALARYGLSVEAAQSVVQNAIGGENVTTTIEGRERYPVNVRYMRDFRSDADALANVLVPASDGQRQIPLGELARVKVATGPAMIRDEDGLLTGYVFVDVAGRDISSYVDEASRVVHDQVKLPPGYAVLWSGQYEAMARVRARLTYVIPLTLLLVSVLLYLNTRSLVKTAIVLLAVPFSAVGAIWYLYLLDYNMSIAVWVGVIALLGVDAQTGVFMLLYLDLSYEKGIARRTPANARRSPGDDRGRGREAAAPEVHDRWRRRSSGSSRSCGPPVPGPTCGNGSLRRWLAAFSHRSSSSSWSTRRSTKSGSGTSR